ncbi:sensor histidine kinase [Fibrella arboris]|uniref:sensor histidine kinase n=1 Tax=Fibrella arboris TaxID=3242486 RepID=UPI0035217A16
MLQRVSAYFFPPDFSGTDENRRQATIIVNSVVLTSLFTLNYVILCVWLHYEPGLYIMLANLLVFVGAILLFKAGLITHVALGYTFNLFGILFVFLECFYLGGFYGDVTIWLVVMPLVGTFLLGKTGGFITLGLSLTLLLVLWYLEYRGVVIPNHITLDQYRLFFRLNIIAGLMLIILIIAFVFTESNNRALRLITEKNDLLLLRTEQLEQSLNELRATQVQLIQKEKMASLGELTAGIAHEIQNPLNFVNNFAEVSSELVVELKEGSLMLLPVEEKGYADEIVGDLSHNLVKISQHGQRASAIVRGMLKHSSSSTGERQPTDLNALTDEYLRLSYHGLRAKDKSFNCQLITDFDPHLPLLNIVGQDIGRVLLNLFTNAFYAVQQKATETGPLASYEPTVSVRTCQKNGKIEVHVQDNGTGVSDGIKAKIFQPFFTTKPTGQGTGLGLSLSYDIVTKGHGGELSLKSQEGNGTEFVVSLPTS